jgi:hypothetical protein
MPSRARCVLEDRRWRRQIVIEKVGARSSVVWNPWAEKAAAMADLGPEVLSPCRWRRPDRGLNRRPDPRQRDGFASVFPNRLSHGCPPTIFWDNSRGLITSAKNSGAGWKRLGQGLAMRSMIARDSPLPAITARSGPSAVRPKYPEKSLPDNRSKPIWGNASGTALSS